MKKLVLLLCVACGAGVISAPANGIGITSPAPDAVVTRDQFGADGTWYAPVTLTATISGTVVSVKWVADDQYDLGTGLSVDYDFTGDGTRAIAAIGLDDQGNEVVRATQSLVVKPPAAVTDCHAMLDAIGVGYTVGPDTMGVADPVTVTMPIDGMPFRYIGATSDRDSLMMDCNLAVAVYRAVEVYKSHGVQRVEDYGVYNYRCIDQTVQPPCPGSSLSEHAHALAIDFAGFVEPDGTDVPVLGNFVKSDPTCPGSGTTANDTFLHTLLCDVWANNIFNIILTWNYNDAHNNHFHMDLTPGANFFRSEVRDGDD
jgi:hypothetical protein